jgi:hypothetical protein
MIYLEEELPEIEITELVSGDEYSSHKKGINIYTEDEIKEQLFLLLSALKSIPLARKVNAFQNIHSAIIAEKPFSFPDYIVPEVSIQRKDNGDDDIFHEAYNEARKNSRYAIRKEALHKAFIGFETTDEEEPVFPSGIPPTTVYIKDTERNMTVILPNDDLTGTVTKLFTKIYSNEGLTLVDKINLIIEISDEAIQIDPSLTLEQNIERIIKRTDEPPSEIPEKKIKELKPSKDYHPVPLTPLDDCSIHGFYITQKKIYNKLQPILKKFKNDLIDLYYEFIDANIEQPEIITTIPNNAFDIALMLLEQQTTIKDVVETIRTRIFIKQKRFIEEWYALIEAWNIDEIGPLLDTELELANKTVLSIIDEPNVQWNSIGEEIKNIKKGEVISKDFTEKVVFESIIGSDIPDDDDDEDTIPIYDDSLPIDISHYDEGTKEVYEIVLKMFVVLQKASGLPLNYIEMKPPNIVRCTRSVEPKTDIEFIKELQSIWMYLLAWWICSLQESVLSYRLQFHTWEGASTCMNVWSPYGMPMEKPQKEGMVPYLVCVIKELMEREGTIWNKYARPFDIQNELNGLFSKEFKEEVSQLQTTFKTFDKELPLKNLIKKGNDVKDKLTQTVKDKNKTNYINDYMNYLRNLPAVLVSSNARYGCCVQKISDIHNEKNTYFKNAYKLKQLFATERLGNEKRPLLMVSGVEKTQDNVPSKIVFKKPKMPAYNEWKAEDVPDIRQIEKVIEIVGKTTPIESQLKNFIFKNTTSKELLQANIKLAQIQYLNIQTKYPELKNKFQFYDLEVNEITNEVQNLQYTRQLQYHFVRMLCFPAKPEDARNNTLVLIEDGYDASLMKSFVKYSVSEITEWIKYKVFNTTVIYSDYISKVREQENIAKLKKIDKMTPEQRAVYVETKKLGLPELNEYINSYEEEKEEENEEEEEVELEDNGMNNDETDDDDLYDI